MIEKGDFVKYKIIDEPPDGDGSVIEEGEAQVLRIQSNGYFVIDSPSGLIAKPSECEKVMPKVEGNWRVSCDIECPKCGHYNDLMDLDEWWYIAQICENKTLKTPEEITCKKCKFEMLLTGTYY
jgi:hypothetical protein